MIKKERRIMTDKELISWCERNAMESEHIEFSDDIFSGMTEEQADNVMHKFEGSTLMKLPEVEIKFFEWLKKNDFSVWNDLWGNDNLNEKPYIVSISFLKQLKENPDRGFPICDLVANDNFFFTMSHMVDKESEIFLDSVRERLKKKKQLSPAQLLALEISLGPIDIWHFAYKYKLDLSTAKAAVAILVDDKVLVHLTDAEHLAPFIDF